MIELEDTDGDADAEVPTDAVTRFRAALDRVEQAELELEDARAELRAAQTALE